MGEHSPWSTVNAQETTPFIGIITHEVLRTAGIIRNKMALVGQAQGRSKLGEEVGAMVRRGCTPQTRQPALGCVRA